MSHVPSSFLIEEHHSRYWHAWVQGHCHATNVKKKTLHLAKGAMDKTQVFGI